MPSELQNDSSDCSDEETEASARDSERQQGVAEVEGGAGSQIVGGMEEGAGCT